jgi:GMP synthase (glutamine-hydrolysing)
MFYQVLGETAKKEKCTALVQGTIKADILETTKGIKTQHNVLEQMGISPINQYGFKIVEPLTTLFKWQVRQVAQELKLPEEIFKRQPFPGPGLSIRVVGQIDKTKLDCVKSATIILEKHFQKHEPSQFYAAIMDNIKIPYTMNSHMQESLARKLNMPSRHVDIKIFDAKATGVRNGKRKYGHIAAFKALTMEGKPYRPSIARLVDLQKRALTVDPSLTRIIYTIREKIQKSPYVVVLRAINTQDFLTADVAEIPWDTMESTADEILKVCPNTSAVYYDVTPKPPATIEME